MHPDKTAKVPVPLQPGETHCVYCAGYGEHPVDKNDTRKSVDRNVCTCCEGAGKLKP